jgi:hypothetical protein
MRLRVAIAALFLMALASPAQTIKMEGGSFRVEGWPVPAPPAAGWDSLFSVYAGEGDLPPMLGTYAVERGSLTFRPRYPIAPGMHVRAELRPPGKPAVRASFDVPRAAAAPSTHVAQVYPSTNLLPENELKLYVYFSGPMRLGEAWQRVHLLDHAGKVVELAFLELDQELWDRDHTRLTILFDPGRIKRGLLPLAESGKILEAGKSYTLAIDREWQDEHGATLAEAYRKEFQVTPARRNPVDPSKWRIVEPHVGTFEPLSIAFPEPLDYALLQRLLQVIGPNGAVEGKVVVTAGETEWRFLPREAWQEGKYRVDVQKALEDLAGNRVGRPFDVDTFAPITREITGEAVSLIFRTRNR